MISHLFFVSCIILFLRFVAQSSYNIHSNRPASVGYETSPPVPKRRTGVFMRARNGFVHGYQKPPSSLGSRLSAGALRRARSGGGAPLRLQRQTSAPFPPPPWRERGLQVRLFRASGAPWTCAYAVSTSREPPCFGVQAPRPASKGARGLLGGDAGPQPVRTASPSRGRLDRTPFEGGQVPCGPSREIGRPSIETLGVRG